MQVPRTLRLSCLLLVASCGLEAGAAGPATPDAASAPDAAPEAGIVGDADIDGSTDESDPTTLTNFSFDDAKSIELGPVGALQPLESASQVDYFSFEAEAGEIYIIATNRGRFTPDNVLTLYGPDRVKLAENDAGGLWQGDAIDARLVVRARQTGRHYVVAEDRVLPNAAFESDAVPTFFYRVTIEHVDPSTLGIGWGPEARDDAAVVAFAVDEGTGVAYVTLVGELEDGEIDHFSVHGGAAQALIGHVLPGGAMGNGSTLTSAVVDVRDADERLVAAIDLRQGAQDIHPPVGDADYTLSVAADGAVGDNGFYAIDLVLLPDNPLEQAGDNDSIETAHALELSGGFLRRGSILAEVAAGDRDYFAFEARAGERLDVVCEGESAGSGVRGLIAEVRDARDGVVGEAAESIAEGLRLERVIASEDGRYYLRLSSETPDDNAAAPAWVRCAVIAEI